MTCLPDAAHCTAVLHCQQLQQRRSAQAALSGLCPPSASRCVSPAPLIPVIASSASAPQSPTAGSRSPPCCLCGEGATEAGRAERQLRLRECGCRLRAVWLLCCRRVLMKASRVRVMARVNPSLLLCPRPSSRSCSPRLVSFLASCFARSARSGSAAAVSRASAALSAEAVACSCCRLRLRSALARQAEARWLLRESMRCWLAARCAPPAAAAAATAACCCLTACSTAASAASLHLLDDAEAARRACSGRAEPRPAQRPPSSTASGCREREKRAQKARLRGGRAQTAARE